MRDLTRKLARPVGRLLGRDDRGAVGVLVGVLLGGGVLLGIGALVVDVGMLYTERAELQNGADAGALGVAKSCALGPCTPDVASTYADANANRDDASAVPLVCGSDDEGGLPGCPASTGTMVDCPIDTPPGNYVDVHTATEEAGGATLLPPVLAQAMLGNAGDPGNTVNACARARWGAPESATTVAFTISFCEWLDATADGTDFPPPGPYPPYPDPSFDRVLKLHSTVTDDTGCAGGPSGADGPGQFGWTDDEGDCSTLVDGGSYSADTGVSAGRSCQDALAEARASATPLLIPIYTTVSGTGTGGSYTLEGFAAFVVTGYSLPGFKATDLLNPANDCKGSDKCINGFFTEALVPGGGTIVDGPDLGATIITLAG